MKVWLQRFKPFLGLVFFLIAVAIVHHELKAYRYEDIAQAVASTPWPLILLAMFLTVLNYITLTGYDFLALKYIGKKIPAAQVMLASLIGFSVSNNVGHALVSGPSVRARFYNAWGLSGIDLMKLTFFLSISYLLGVLTLAVLAFFILPAAQLENLPIYLVVRGVIYSACAALTLYWGIIFLWRKPIRFRNMELILPSPGMTCSQTVIAGIELVFASLVLYVFIRHQENITFVDFLMVYLIAQIVGLYSQVPGGVGVFEGVFLSMLGKSVSAHNLVGALVLYRVVYYLVPLALAGIALLVYEVLQRRKKGTEHAQALWSFLGQLTPQLFSLLLLVSGGILLFSGATPADSEALHFLKGFMPLPVLELSHLLGSVVGVLLLFLARAVFLRLDAAYFASLSLLLLGMFFSLMKGFDWQEASLLCFMLVLMLPTRRFFYRKSALLDVPFTWQWFTMIGVIIAASTWLGFFSYKHMEYRHELLWQFAYIGDGPRFLRAFFVMSGVMISFALYRLLRVSPEKGRLPSAEEIDTLRAISDASSTTQSHLALLGDKIILWSESHRSYLMYDVSRAYWIAMGDPVGDPAEMEALVWRFREAADRQGAKVAFYQVSKDFLPLYLDLGLMLIKLGEEARIPLNNFALEGSHRSGLRQTHNKLLKQEMRFEVLNYEEVLARMTTLKAISDDWLLTKSAREKQFSLGFFSERYLAHTRVGVAKQGDQILAFANLWETRGKQELSIDLMRYAQDAPGGVMEWLLIQIMLWGKAQGYQWFNLGMAPLSGLEKHPLAPLWHKIGNIIFEHGEAFYHFEGLRAYKAKFDPVWEPRYLAAPPGLRVPAILFNVTRLIAGGRLKGVFEK